MQDYPLTRGQYEVHRTGNAFHSIRHRTSGEIMHSVIAPTEEARKLYLDQSQLIARVSVPRTAALSPSPSELVVWDVGLGAATNAMTVVRAYEALAQPTLPLRLVSFELDLDPVHLASSHSELFPELQHPSLSILLEQGKWISESGNLKWNLILGDFLKTYTQAPRPDLIFFDPFSSKTNPEFWQLHPLQGLYQYCQGQDPGQIRAVELYTYSASTAFRAALLVAGFSVCRGVGTGKKLETTIAVLNTKRRADLAFLDRAWLGKWGRSTAQYPADIEEGAREEFQARLFAHPQWE